MKGVSLPDRLTAAKPSRLGLTERQGCIGAPVGRLIVFPVRTAIPKATLFAK
jgi:hypothetical protein